MSNWERMYLMNPRTEITRPPVANLQSRGGLMGIPVC